MTGGTVSSPAMSLLRKSAVSIPLLTTLAALMLSLRVVERGEIWNDRTYWLVGTAAFGGFAGALASRLLLRQRKRRFPRLVASGVFTGFFMLGMMTAFVAQSLIFSGQFEPHPDRVIRATLFASLQIATLFLISCPAYLLPWPLPLLSAAAGLLLAPATPVDSAKAVEPGGDGV